MTSIRGRLATRFVRAIGLKGRLQRLADGREARLRIVEIIRSA